MVKNDSKKSDISHKTLFIRGIPGSCDNDQLLEEFCKVGPIKDCFVVKPKGQKNSKKTCIGYVTYLAAQDAKQALQDANKFDIGGKKLQISYSLKKYLSKKAQLDKYEGADKTVSFTETNKEDLKKNEKNKKSTPNNKTFVLSVSNLPKDCQKDNLLKLWKETKLMDPVDVEFSSNNGSAVVSVVSKQQALKACHHLMGKKVGDNTLQVVFNDSKISAKNAKKSKLIVRNLSFKCEESNLKDVFSKFGKVIDVKIPVSNNGKKRGFGFVQFTNVFEAMKAMKSLNREEILNRKVAIDWAVAQKDFSNVKKVEEEDLKPEEEDGDDSESDVVVDEENESDEDISSEDENNEDESDDEDEDEEEDSDSEDSGLEHDKSSTDENAYDKDLKQDTVKSKPSDTDQSLFVRNLNSETDEDGLKKAMKKYGTVIHAAILRHKDSAESKCCGFVKFSTKESMEKCLQETGESGIIVDGTKAQVLPAKKREDVLKNQQQETSDINEGRTVFLRNLSFDSSEDDVLEAVNKYGEVVYARVVYNKSTGMSKGCAFVKFANKESADEILAEAGEGTSGIMITSRMVIATPAVTRQDSDKINKEKKAKEPKDDKRHLYLAREGLIRPGTKAAEGLSQVEIKKRENIENAKRQKLKNPNVIVSTTRLCVHNLPRHVDDQRLKEIILTSNDELKKHSIIECRIMRDMKHVSSEGVGRSLGFGFVDFKQHEQALKTLRNINNNPKIFGHIKRPIVEFSLENTRVLKIKEMRREKMKQKQSLKRKMQEDITTDDKPKIQKKKNIGGDSTKQEKKIKHKPLVLPRTSDFQGNTGTTSAGKKLPLSLHSKPKLRKRNKGKILDQLKKSKKLNKPQKQTDVMKKSTNKRKVEQSANVSGKSYKKNKPNQDQEFNKLVAKYTKVIQGAQEKHGGKWFE